MIHHASIPAERPEAVARTIAALWGGRAYPLPILHPGAWAAMPGDAHGSMIEVLPRAIGFRHAPGEHVELFEGPGTGETGWHVLIASPFDGDRIVAIAAEHGVAAHVADHGGLPIAEVWLDGCVLLEVMAPETAATYRQAITFEAGEALLAMANAA